jgi:peptidoglycan/LPS O-acetylase OafA/YrhL
MIIANNEQKTFPFITLLQFIAVLLITWDHLVGAWSDWNQIAWIPLKHYTSIHINQPFGIIQDFGFIGVSLIFLTSGFLITHVAQSESRKEFGLKRLLEYIRH